MEIEELVKQVDDYISKGNLLEAFVLVSSEANERINNNTFDKVADKFAKIYEKLSPYTSQILNDFKTKAHKFLKIVNEIISVYPEVKPYMKRKDRKKFEEAVKEHDERIEQMKETILKLESIGKSSLGDIQKEFSFFTTMITNGYLTIIMPLMLTMTQLLSIYDDYMDYVPTHKMPTTFEQETKEKYDDADDLLFIDDMDE